MEHTNHETLIVHKFQITTTMFHGAQALLLSFAFIGRHAQRCRPSFRWICPDMSELSLKFQCLVKIHLKFSIFNCSRMQTLDTSMVNGDLKTDGRMEVIWRSPAMRLPSPRATRLIWRAYLEWLEPNGFHMFSMAQNPAKPSALLPKTVGNCRYSEVPHLVGGWNLSAKNSQLGLWFLIYRKMKNVPNHRPVTLFW